MAKRLGSVLALIVLMMTGLVGWGAAPAAAALCSPGSGVSVVLDFTTVPGGGSRAVETKCVANGAGKSAYEIFKAAGYAQKGTTRFPGFICRIDGLPANDPCFTASPADAYWALFWSNGKDGKWIYSNLGVMGLTVPNGGTVSWNFQSNNNTTTPRATPPQGSGASSGGQAPGSTSAPGQVTTTRSPATNSSGPIKSTQATKASPRQARSTAPTASVSAPTPSATTAATTPATPAGTTAATTAGPTGGPTEAASASVSQSVQSAPTTAQIDPTSASVEDEGLPVWVPIVAIALLAVGAATAVVLRRRSVRL